MATTQQALASSGGGLQDIVNAAVLARRWSGLSSRSQQPRKQSVSSSSSNSSSSSGRHCRAGPRCTTPSASSETAPAPKRRTSFGSASTASDSSSDNDSVRSRSLSRHPSRASINERSPGEDVSNEPPTGGDPSLRRMNAVRRPGAPKRTDSASSSSSASETGSPKNAKVHNPAITPESAATASNSQKEADATPVGAYQGVDWNKLPKFWTKGSKRITEEEYNWLATLSPANRARAVATKAAAYVVDMRG